MQVAEIRGGDGQQQRTRGTILDVTIPPPRKRAVQGGDNEGGSSSGWRTRKKFARKCSPRCSRSEINQDPPPPLELNKMIYRCVRRSLKNRSEKRERERVLQGRRMIETTEDYEINVSRELTMEF